MQLDSYPAKCAWRSLILFCSLTFSIQAQESYQPMPIPSGPEAKTYADFQKRLLDYYRKNAFGPQTDTTDPEAARSRTEELFAEVANGDVYRVRSETAKRTLTLVQQLIDQGSRDPLILQQRGICQVLLRDYEAAGRQLVECESLLNKDKHGLLPFVWNSQYLCQIARKTNNDELLNEQSSELVQRLLEWLVSGAAQPDTLRFVQTIAMYPFIELPPERRSQFLRTLEGRAGIDPWLHDILRARHEVDEAFQWMESDVFNSFSAVGRQGEHWEAAATSATRAWSAHPEFPEAASVMIAVNTAGLGDRNPRLWFDRTVALEMDYAGAYRNYCNALWNSEYDPKQAMYQFGLECLATKRFDTAVPQKFLDMVLQIGQPRRSRRLWSESSVFNDREPGLLPYESNDENKTVWSDQRVYAKFKELFDGLLSVASESVAGKSLKNRKFVLSWQAIVAMKSQQWQDAVRALELIGPGNPDDDLLDLLELFQLSQRDIGLACTAAEAGNESFLAAEKILAEDEPTLGEVARARQLLLDAKAKSQGQRAIQFIDARISACDAITNFRNGKWAHLRFDTDFPNWYPQSGKWAVGGPDKMLSGDLVRGNGSDETILPHMLKFERPFRLDAELEFGPHNRNGVAEMGLKIFNSSSRDENSRLANISWRRRFYYGAYGDVSVALQVVNWRPQESEATNADTSEQNQGTGPGSAAGHRYRLQIRAWQDTFLVFLDGVGPQELTKQALRTNEGPGTSLFVTFPGMPDRAEISNVRIIKLPYSPPPGDNDPVIKLKHAQEMVAFDPEDIYALECRGRAYFQSEKFNEALADFQAIRKLGPATAEIFAFQALCHGRLRQFEEAQVAYREARKQRSARRLETPYLLAELTSMEGTPLFNPTEGVHYAEYAYNGKQQERFDNWKFDVLLCKAYAYTSQFELAQSSVETARSSGAPEAIVTQLQELIAAQQDLRQRSYRIAWDSLLHEGNSMNRLMGGVLFVLLLAANIALVRPAFRKGWLAGLAAGAFCAGISALIPAVMAILFRVGEGVAFQQLMLTGVAAVAVVGGLAGAATGAYGKRQQ